MCKFKITYCCVSHPFSTCQLRSPALDVVTRAVDIGTRTLHAPHSLRPGRFAFLIILPCRCDLDGQATRNRRTKSHVMQVMVLLTAQPKVIAETRLTRIECRYSAVHSCVRYPRESINQRPRGPLSRHVRHLALSTRYLILHSRFAEELL